MPSPPAKMPELCRHLTLPATPANPRNSEGDLVALADGRLRLIYSRFDGGRGSDLDHGALAQVTSPDGGQSWPTPPEPVFAREGAANDMSVTLRRLADGRLALFNLRKHSKNDCRLLMRVSHDEGATWAAPVHCLGEAPGYFVVNNDRVLQTRSGRLIVPAAQLAGASGPLDMLGELCFAISDDGGRHWRRSPCRLVGHLADGSRYQMQEPGLLQVPDGRLLLWVRTNTGSQHFAWSSDEGESFSEPLPGPLSSPRAPASLKLIPGTSDLVAVWNPLLNGQISGAGSRARLALACSRDLGRTWSTPRLLGDQPGDGFSYTAMQFIGERFWLSYGHSADGRGLLSQVLVSLPRAWLDQL